MWYIVFILTVLLILSYMGYRLYDSKKVPKDTPDIIKDINNKVKKTVSKGKKN